MMPLAERLTLNPHLRAFLETCESEKRRVFFDLVQIGQAEGILSQEKIEETQLHDLLNRLVSLDWFYREMGGLVGYHERLRRLARGDAEEKITQEYREPPLIDLTHSHPEAVEWGIEGLPLMAEMYPVGGAADRLHLVDEETGSELPAAKLVFEERTLLEGLIRDLIAREMLYFRKTGRRVVTPVALMTSAEKDNHRHVQEICQEAKWWGRPREMFRFFEQPLVPAVDTEGNWCWVTSYRPLWKPGGHGAIWKLARDEGIFEWLKNLGRTKVLIRQINNPLAGIDEGLLAFYGVGLSQEAHFGFVSCPRLPGAAEGVLARQNGRITCVEYCDFEKAKIDPDRFPANVNILFADLQALEQTVAHSPFPGLLVNFKKARYRTAQGETQEGLVARLESTMQNIGESFPDHVFVVSEPRLKVLSPAKRAYVKGGALRETPEHALYDLLRARRELLLSCGFQLPPEQTIEEMLKGGPSFFFRYHPALGPLYSDLRKRLKGGRLSWGASWVLEIADAEVENLQINGSLIIEAEDPLDATCRLKDVVVENAGVDWSRSHPLWKGKWEGGEAARIFLKKGARFEGSGLVLKGNQSIVVES